VVVKKAKRTYVVGYGQPPKATRFKKGESGNPKGRPKGSRSVGALLQEILEQRIAVTENGRTRRVAALEVMLRRLANDAMRNDVAALKTILTLVDRYGEAPESQIKLDELLEEDRAILANFLPQLQSAPKKTNRKGTAK
jgi:hypothetical protein